MLFTLTLYAQNNVPLVNKCPGIGTSILVKVPPSLTSLVLTLSKSSLPEHASKTEDRRPRLAYTPVVPVKDRDCTSRALNPAPLLVDYQNSGSPYAYSYYPTV